MSANPNTLQPPAPPGRRMPGGFRRGGRGGRRPPITITIPVAEEPQPDAAGAPNEAMGKLVYKGVEYSIRGDDFRRGDKLGAGAFGDVYKVQHVPTNAIMAVKEMRDSIKREERSKLFRDIEIIRHSQECEYTVDYYGAQCREGYIMVYMELMQASLDMCYEGLRARDLWLPNFVLVYIAISVLKGMLYLKEKLGVLHRDIKPSNILLGANGEIKLCDFGMSKVMEQSLLHTNVGCERYLAPERLDPELSKGEYGTESDVWSYGVSIVELGVLEFPYRYSKAFELFQKIVNENPPLLPSDKYSKDLCDFIEKCLDKRRGMRPQLLRSPTDDPSQPALKECAFFVGNKDNDTTQAREWLVENSVQHLQKRS